MRWLLPLLILLVGIGGFAALKASRPDGTPLQSREKTWIVAVERVVPRTVSPTLTLYGRVQSPRATTLSAAVEADVTEVHVLEGEDVSEDDLLVTLDDRESQLLLRQREAEAADIRAQIESETTRHQADLAALEQERALLALSRKAVHRADDLARSNVGSQSQLDDSRQQEARQRIALDARKMAIAEYPSRIAQFRARLARAEALRDLAQLDVEQARILAPFNGRVSRVSTSPGNRVRKGDKLLSLYDTSSLEVRAQIPTAHLAEVRLSLSAGDPLPATAVIDNRPVRTSLERLSGEVVAGSGGIDGLFRVVDNGRWLALGRTVEMVVSLPPQQDAVVLPPEAIYGTDRVYKLRDGRMKAVRVSRVGELRAPDGQARVLVRGPDLAAGEQVIVTQLPNASDGLRVRVLSEQPAP